MKILVVAPRPPYPLHGGYEVRVYPLFKALSAANEITLISKAPSPVDRQSLVSLEEVFETVELYPVRELAPDERSGRTLWKRISDFVSPPPGYHEPTTFSRDMCNSIRTKTQSGEYDIIHYLGVGLIAYLPCAEQLPCVCDAVDDYSLYCYRTIRHRRAIADKARYFLEWLVTRRFERKYLSKFREVVFVSPVDAKEARSICPAARISVVPNGVDCDYFRPSGKLADKPKVLFTGVMDYEPNVTGAVYFLREVLPILERSYPAVQFRIVGRDPLPELLEAVRPRPNVEVTGFVEDMRPHFDDAMIYVSPLKSGAGLKNKILEAWAMAKPVVATATSCDGIEVRPGEDIIIADTPADLAEAVLSVLNDPVLRKKLSENGRKKALSLYSWQSQAEKFMDIYRRVLSKEPCSADRQKDATLDRSRRR